MTFTSSSSSTTEEPQTHSQQSDTDQQTAPHDNKAPPSPPVDGVAPVGSGMDALEIFRKSMHMGPAILPFVFFFVTHPDPLDKYSLIFVASLITFLACIFMGFFKLVRRPGETNFISTVVSYPAIICFTLLIFPGNAEFTSVVVIILALGDGSACIFGRLFGKSRLPWNQNKSWVGTLFFVLISAPIATIAFYLEAKNPSVSMGTAAICALTASILAAVAESLPVRLTDNLRVGVASLLGVALSAKLLGVLHQETFLTHFFQ